MCLEAEHECECTEGRLTYQQLALSMVSISVAFAGELPTWSYYVPIVDM